MRSITLSLRFGLLCSLMLWGGNQSGVASTINPNQPGATTNYNSSSGPIACGGGRTCTTKLDPPGVVNLGAAGSTTGNSPLATNITELQTALTAEFPGFTYAYGGDLSSLVFNVTTYSAFNTGVGGGARFILNVETTSGNLPSNLHWVQWLTNNWNITGYDPAPGASKGPGSPENVIDGTYPTKTKAGSPFYDVGDSFNTTPPIFQDKAQRGEPTLASPVVTWEAWLFLVSSPSENGNAKMPVTITFYDGLEWGFQTTVAPLAPTWTMMLIGLGVMGYILRRQTVVRRLTLRKTWPALVPDEIAVRWPSFNGKAWALDSGRAG